jgi:sulfite reductase alpha subunit-like flavoprotein
MFKFFRKGSKAAPKDSGPPREEKVLVLFGSQRGKSEEAAKGLFNDMKEKLSFEIEKLGGNIIVEPVILELDEWLKNPWWTRLVVIVVSSFGRGDAPANASNFRELCDKWIDLELVDPFLDGVNFALLGLGGTYSRKY